MNNQDNDDISAASDYFEFVLEAVASAAASDGTAGLLDTDAHEDDSPPTTSHRHDNSNNSPETLLFQEKKRSQVTLRPGESLPINFCISGPTIRRQQEEYGRLVLTQLVAMHSGSVEVEITTRYRDRTRQGIVALYKYPQPLSAAVDEEEDGPKDHALVKAIPTPAELPGSDAAWIFAELTNPKVYFWNRQNAVLDFQSAILPLSSPATQDEQDRVRVLRQILHDGMAEQLGDIFGELLEMDDSTRHSYVLSIQQNDFAVVLLRQLEQEDITNRNGDIGAKHGMLAGAATGAAATAAAVGYGAWLFAVALGGPVVLAGTAVAGAVGGGMVGRKIGRKAGELATSEEDAARAGATQAAMAVGMMGAAAMAATTAAYALRAILELFVKYMKILLKEIKKSIWKLFQKMVKLWKSISLKDRKSVMEAATKAFASLLKSAKLPCEMAPLLVTLCFLFMEPQQSAREKIAPQQAVRSREDGAQRQD